MPVLIHEILIPSLVTVFVGGPVSFILSVFVVRLTFFFQTKQQAALFVTDFFNGMRGGDDMNPHALRNRIVRRMASLASEFRAQGQAQSGEDLSQVLDRIQKTCDDTMANPPQEQLHLRAKNEDLWRWAILNEILGRHAAEWVAEVNAIRPTLRECFRIGPLHFPEKKVVVKRGY